MEEVLALLDTWGYALLFAYCLFGGYVGLVCAAMLSAFGKFDICISIAIAFFANALGSSFIAYCSRKYRYDFLGLFKRYSREIVYCQWLLRKYSKTRTLIIFVSKYIHIIRILVPISIGLSRCNLKKYYLINTLASITWALVVGFGVYFSGNALIAFITRFDLDSRLIALVIIIWCMFMILLFRFISSKVFKKIK